LLCWHKCPSVACCRLKFSLCLCLLGAILATGPAPLAAPIMIVKGTRNNIGERPLAKPHSDNSSDWNLLVSVSFSSNPQKHQSRRPKRSGRRGTPFPTSAQSDGGQGYKTRQLSSSRSITNRVALNAFPYCGDGINRNDRSLRSLVCQSRRTVNTPSVQRPRTTGDGV